MALSPKQQIHEMIKKSANPLIFIPQNPEGDAVSSALALSLILKKLGKNPEVACSTAIAEKFLFLPEQKSIRHNASAERLYKIAVSVDKNDIKELSYEQTGSVLNIYLGLKNNSLERESISVEPSKFKYDLILILGSPDFESLGRLYFENTELFFQTPIVNIDHHPSNEYFGTVNYVEVTSSSTSEIIAEIAKTLLPEGISDKIATLLLAGVISETDNFQNSNISPKTFILAASLLSAGAAQEEIIRHFYKTKPLAVLKLVGHIISNMNFDPHYRLAWAKISQNDFKKSEANPRDVDMAINELVNNSRDIDSLLVTYEDSGSVTANVWSDKKYDIDRLASDLDGERKNRKIIISGNGFTIGEFEQKMLAKLKSFIQNSAK